MAYRFVARRRSDRTASSVPSASLSEGRKSSTPMTDQQKLASSIANQQTRLQSVGETPKELDKTPTWVKVLTALDKPGSAARTGLLEMQKSANQEAKFTSVADAIAATKRMLSAGAKGIGTGWEQGDGAATGRDILQYALDESTKGMPSRAAQDTTAANLAPGLRDKIQAAGADKQGKTGNVAKEIGGFAVEALLDPLNLVTTGAGTVLKGVATKGGSKATKEAAEALARAQLSRATGEVAERAAAKRVTKDMVDNLAMQTATGTTVGPPTAAALDAARKAAKDTLGKKALADETADRIAYALKKADAKGAAPDVDTAAKMIADVKTSAAKRAAGPGLSIAGKTIVPEEKLIAAGGKIRQGLEHVPIVKKVMDTTDKVFNSRFILGADAATQEVMYALKQGAKRRKGALDAQSAEMFMKQAKTVRGEAMKYAPNLRKDKIREFDRDIIDVLEGTKQPAQLLSPEVAKVAQEMKDYYRKIGVEEYEAGILHSVMNDRYAPHILSSESPLRQAKGGISGGTLKVISPSARKRDMGNTLDDANRRMQYKGADIAEKEALTDALHLHFGVATPRNAAGEIVTPYAQDLGRVTDALADDWIARQVSAGMPQATAEAQARTLIDQANDLYDSAMPTASTQAKAFSESGVAGFLTRALQHNRVLTSKEFIDEAVAAFGTPVGSIRKAKELEAAGKQVVIRRSSIQPAVLLGAGQPDELADIGAALDAVRSAGGTVGTTISQLSPDMQQLAHNLLSGANGKSPLIKITPEQWDLLAGEGSALLLRPIMSDAYAFDPIVLKSITESAIKQVDAAGDAIGNVVDLLYSKWKPLVTGLKAGYHIRNFMGGTANNFLDIGMRAFDPRTSAKAADTIGKTDATVLPGYTGKDLWEVALDKGVMQGTHAAEFSEEATRAAEKRLYKGMMKPGQTLPQRIGEVAGNVSDIPQKVGKKVGNVVEGQVRLTNFIANVEAMTAKGVPIEQAFDLAADSVRKFQFDYSDLTEAERTVLRRIFPFYTWMRNNIPLQVEQALNQPGKYVMFSRAMKDFAPESDKQPLPGYMQETMAVPVPGTGTEQGSMYANLNLPMQDINNMLQPGKTLLTSLNPLAKVAIELPLNKNILTGGPIWKDSDPPDAKTQKIINYLIQQLGILGVATRSGLETLGDKEKAVPGTKPVEAAFPGFVGDITGLSSILKRYNIEPATLQDQYNLNTLLKNQIAQTEAEQGIEVPTMADLKQQGGYQYVPRPARRAR